MPRGARWCQRVALYCRKSHPSARSRRQGAGSTACRRPRRPCILYRPLYRSGILSPLALPFHRFAPDLLRRRCRITAYTKHLVPERHALGGEDPVHHACAHVVVDSWLEDLRAPYGLEILCGRLWMLDKPDPDVHELLLHHLPAVALLGAHARPRPSAQ